MKLFEKIFKQQLKENNAAAAGGVFGDAPSMGHGGTVQPAGDVYASGDMRTPKGGKKSAHPTVKSKKVKKTKKNGSIEVLVPTQRRPFNTSM